MLLITQKYLWPVVESRKRRYCAVDVVDATGAAKTFYATSPSTRSHPGGGSVALSTTSSDSERLEARMLQIERSVGLSGGCRLCIRVANILHKHVQACMNTQCSVLYCADLKHINADQASTT